MIIPTFFCVGVLVWLGIYELRKWLELFAGFGRESEEAAEANDLPESVKHMYN